LRGIIDKNRRAGHTAGQFLFLGSASIDLLKQSGETLAGRIAYCELSPITLAEYPEDMDRLWLRGGFPDSLLASNDKKSLLWRNNFIRTYLERDIPQLGPRIPARNPTAFLDDAGAPARLATKRIPYCSFVRCRWQNGHELP